MHKSPANLAQKFICVTPPELGCVQSWAMPLPIIALFGFLFTQLTNFMRQALLISILAAIGLGIPRPITAAAAEAAAIANFHGPKDAVILIIRHAEKPEIGIELSPAGYQRAAAYPAYFRNFKVDSQPVVLDAIYA